MKLDFNFKESTENFNFDLSETNQEIVTDFEEVHEVGSVVVDPTLTIEGAAADAKAVGDALKTAYTKLTLNTVLGFYCIEDVTIVTNGVPKTYPANSNVEISFVEGDVFEVIPTSDKSILTLTAFPGALGTFYPWLEGVEQFSNILFDMNDEDMYTKWNQGNQGAYNVQYAQYTNCIFWSDNPYINDVAKRTNYTLYYSAQLPLCYSNIPDNTFKAFYLAFGVNSDPNWGNKTYRDSFAKATWATQVFSYYGARTIGIFGHDDPDFNITLPTDCRGLMCEATAIENAGTFDAINTTNFGAKQGSWRDAFRMCYSLRNLYIKNLKVNLNISWSPINYESIYFIISKAANTKKITISVSPYTYNLLSPSDFELATSKNIVIELLTTNYVEDKRLSAITNKVDKTYVDDIASEIPNSATVNEQNELVMQHGENPLFSVPLPSSGDSTKFETIYEYEYTESIAKAHTFDTSKEEYLIQVLIPTVDKQFSTANTSVFGANSNVYYKNVGSTSNPALISIYSKFFADNVQFQVYSYSTLPVLDASFTPKTLSVNMATNIGVFFGNRANGFNVGCNMPVGTKIRIMAK